MPKKPAGSTDVTLADLLKVLQNATDQIEAVRSALEKLDQSQVVALKAPETLIPGRLAGPPICPPRNGVVEEPEKSKPKPKPKPKPSKKK